MGGSPRSVAIVRFWRCEHRRLSLTTLPLCATLGIQLAPPAVGAVAYLSITHGEPDLVAQALVGYGLLQALLLIRLGSWIGQAVRRILLGLQFRCVVLGARGDATDR
jgi:tellurite resistance protein TehA-like permease